MRISCGLVLAFGAEGLRQDVGAEEKPAGDDEVQQRFLEPAFHGPVTRRSRLDSRNCGHLGQSLDGSRGVD